MSQSRRLHGTILFSGKNGNPGLLIEKKEIMAKEHLEKYHARYFLYAAYPVYSSTLVFLSMSTKREAENQLNFLIERAYSDQVDPQVEVMMNEHGTHYIIKTFETYHKHVDMVKSFNGMMKKSPSTLFYCSPKNLLRMEESK
jgi:hypothetical protein